MHLTVSIEDQVVERAQNVARERGKSLEELLGELVEQLAAQDDAERDIQELRRLSRESRGRSRGWRFDRDEIHERA